MEATERTRERSVRGEWDKELCTTEIRRLGLMQYIVRSCKKCANYSPDNDDADPCIICRRYFDDYFEPKGDGE